MFIYFKVINVNIASENKKANLNFLPSSVFVSIEFKDALYQSCSPSKTNFSCKRIVIILDILSNSSLSLCFDIYSICAFN